MGKVMAGNSESEMNKDRQISLSLNYLHLIVPMVLVPRLLLHCEAGGGGGEGLLEPGEGS